MAGFTYHGKDRIYFAARAQLIETQKEVASDWASKHIVVNPALAWILGKFVEADNANSNQQYFTLEGLQMYQPTITHSPMNMNHSERNIVGAFVASELIYPMTEEADDGAENPFIESLGVFWKFQFPDEYRVMKSAYDSGQLFYSMECVPRAFQTVGGSDDSKEYAYDGPFSNTYPSEINERQVPINMVDPHFVGGALIIPPVKPGWKKAEVRDVAGFMQKEFEMAESLYDGFEAAASDLESRQWEALMLELLKYHAVQP